MLTQIIVVESELNSMFQIQTLVKIRRIENGRQSENDS